MDPVARTPEDVIREVLDTIHSVSAATYAGRYALPGSMRAKATVALDALVAERDKALLNARDLADVRRRSDAEVRARAEKAEAERDAALRDAQQLRDALTKIDRLAGGHPGVNEDAFEDITDITRAALSSEGQPRAEVGCAVCNPLIAARIIEAEPLPRETPQGAPGCGDPECNSPMCGCVDWGTPSQQGADEWKT